MPMRPIILRYLPSLLALGESGYRAIDRPSNLKSLLDFHTSGFL